MGCMGGGGDPAAEARKQEIVRKQNIQQGLSRIDQVFSQFNPSFYSKRADAYTRFALPQLAKQLGQTQRQTFFSLADRGLQKSSAANRLNSELNEEADTQRRGIVDAGIAQSQDLQKQVESSRSNLIGQLQASADPVSAAQQALSAASTFTAPSTFAPIGNLFGNFANLYAANQTAKAYNPASYKPGIGASTPLGASAYTISK